MKRPQADRRRLLDEANRARANGQRKRAVSIYRMLRGEDPEDITIAFRLAELLAAEGESFEAWNLFRFVGRRHLRAGNPAECLATFREATSCLPFEFDAWRITADLLLKQGRTEEAHLTLLEGRRQFRSRFDRAQAIELLLIARRIEAWDHALEMDLANLYAQSDQGNLALEILNRLAVHSEGRELRSVRWLQWQISHSFHYLRSWLRAVMNGNADRESDDSLPENPLVARVRW